MILPMRIIVMEGLDGSGKSTQVERLRRYLEHKAIPYKYIHFPRLEESIFGELIARFLRGELGEIDQVNPYLVATLYAADRADCKRLFEQWLAEGYILLLDRYVYSNIAYQCAKTPDAEAAERLRNWILHLEYNYYGLPRPDLTLFLDVPFAFTRKNLTSVRSGSDRAYLDGQRDIHEEDLSFQERVRKIYLLQEKDPHFEKICCTDANAQTILPPDAIFAKVLETLTSYHFLK